MKPASINQLWSRLPGNCKWFLIGYFWMLQKIDSNSRHGQFKLVSASLQRGSITVGIMVSVGAVLLFGALLTGIVYRTIDSQQKELSIKEFVRQVDDATAHLNHTIQLYSTLVLALQAHYHASREVSRVEFREFFRTLTTDKLSSVEAVSWNALVKLSDKADFERAVRLDKTIEPQGYPNFSIRPVSDNAMSYVVTYLEPMQDNEGAFGFDLGVFPDRLALVEKARDTGKVVATAPITLAQDTGDKKGFLMVRPVYKNEIPGELQTRIKKFRGIVVSVFRIGDLISSSGKLKFTS